MSRQTADIICRALIAIVAALRKEYELPPYNNITVEIHETNTITGTTGYNFENMVK